MMLPNRRVVPLRSKKSMAQYLWRTKESLDFAWALRAAAAAAPDAKYIAYMEARRALLSHSEPRPIAQPRRCSGLR